MTSDQSVPETLLISGNEAKVSARLNKLLGASLDEVMVSLVPLPDSVENEQQTRLMHLVGRL